jgi:hypothetical protein
MIKQHSLVFLAATAAALWGGMLLPVNAQALKDTQKDITPGFQPDTGKINPGVGTQAPAGAPPGVMERSGEGANVTNKAPPSDTHAATNEPIPTPGEARAALMEPDSPDAAIGQVGLPPTGDLKSAKSVTGDAPDGNAKSQQADNNAQEEDGGKETTGNAPRDETAKRAAHQTSPDKPIGSTTQTLPAKFSKRNDVLDRLPTMAWPLQLDDQTRRKVFETVMNDKSAPADIGKLKPADQLPAGVAQNGMHPLSQDLAANPDLNNVQAVKGKTAVLLVNPATRIVVDVITN